MTRILGISGRKQSGKNTTCNFLFGMEMISIGVIKKFQMNESGNLVVPSLVVNERNEEYLVNGIFDITRTDTEFTEYMSQFIWPFIKDYSFADILKHDICMGVLGLSREQCYGTDKDKNSKTHIKWKSLPDSPSKKKGNMTAREVMQYIGTDFFRKIYPNVWADCGIKRAISHGSQLAIFTDVRFPNEVEAIRSNGGKVIRMMRNSDSSDCHESETALDNESYDWKNFDAIIENDSCDVKETNRIVYDKLAEWDWVDNDFSVNSVEPKEPIKILEQDESGYVTKAKK